MAHGQCSQVTCLDPIILPYYLLGSVKEISATGTLTRCPIRIYIMSCSYIWRRRRRRCIKKSKRRELPQS
ncbi:uncharacterized protein M6B38_146520 [Iris pallida]|uniref:Uncharacterized protein n=1 Tax=Iris pallida TaxID=29817 RepID=A0AAX6F9E5_IRIPA|nr:uncharacterized protein M6B38_146520 [Iris pallida]